MNKLPIKEKLEIIGAKIGKMKLEMAEAQVNGNYETWRLKRSAIEIANQEFKRLAKQYEQKTK